MVINYRAEGVRKNRHAEGSTGGHPAFFSHWSLIGSFPKIGFESTIHAVCRKKKGAQKRSTGHHPALFGHCLPHSLVLFFK